MHRIIGFVSKRFVRLRPGENRKVTLTFLYFFLIITAYYVIKPVSRSIVLGDLGSHIVPYIDLICAVLMGPVVTVFAHLVDCLPKPRLVSLSFWAVIGVLVVFWKLLRWPYPWISGAFYVWVAIFSVLVVTLFWLVANDLYRPREAKRLFGFIGSGGILGGIAGSSIAVFGARLVGSENLVLLSAALLIACWFVVRELWRLAPERIQEQSKSDVGGPQKETFLSHPGGFLKLLLESRYLLLLIAMVCLNKIIATLIYYQLNPFIEQAFPNQDARTAFAGMFFGAVNVSAFIIQFFFTSWILRRWGLLVALLTLPFGVLAGSAGLLFMPVLWLAAATELYDGSMNYSLQQTAKEVLYLPIDRSIRYKVKPFIDMVVFRFGKGIAAIIGIILLDRLGLQARILSYITVPMIVAWLVISAWLRRDYVSTIRTMLQARAVARRLREQSIDEALEQHGGESFNPFGALTYSRPSTAKLVLIQKLITTGDVTSSDAKALVSELTSHETAFANTSELSQDASLLKTIVRDEREPIAKRRMIIRMQSRQHNQDTVDHLLGLVTVESEAILRHEALLGLVKLRLGPGALEFSPKLIRRLISREVATYNRIVDVASIYRRHYHGSLSEDDAVLALLKLLGEESVEQVFRLLMLIYRPEDIHLVYEQLRESDAYVRTDAIELLDNLVDATTRATILPLFDEDQFLSLTSEDSSHINEPAASFRIIQEAIWDHHCWLSVVTLCAVGRLRLTTMRQELERACQHDAPLISSAARFALRLSAISS